MRVSGRISRQSITTTEVPADWSLTPTGLAAGDQFRLLFLSSTKRDGSATDIATYNTFVQGLAAAGHADIQSYSTGFQVVGCTADTDARDNTSTTYTSTDKGVPIYWLNGAKAADEYEDFYDGDWDDEANDKNESGTNGPDTSVLTNYPVTGCQHDGTESSPNGLGTSHASGLRVGRPNSSDSAHGPIGSDVETGTANNRPMYGLSAVFQVAVAASTPATGTPAITAPNVFRVPAVLGVDLTGITDTDGTTGIATSATYKWQRFAADGTTLDTDSIGTDATYTLTDADAGKTLKVVVSFTDDASNSEGPLTSAATSAITAAATDCNAPTLTGGATFLGSARKVGVGIFGGGMFYGFSKTLGSGSLDNAAFTSVTSKDYEIVSLGTSNGAVAIQLDQRLSAPDQSTLVMHICDQAYEFRTWSEPAMENPYYLFAMTGQDWSPHAERTIYLSQEPPSVPLVSNLEQTADASATYTRDHGQAFTTGSNSGGYTVTSVTIRTEDPNNDAIPLQICEVDSSTHPTTVCTDLTAPDTFPQNTALVYNAPTSPALTLDADTTYMLVFKAPPSPTALRVGATTSDSEDSTSLAGWSIRNTYQWYNNSNTWADATNARAIRLIITGKANTNTNAPAAGVPAVTAPNAFRVPAVLGVDLSGITDADGTTNIASSATYKWQWFAADGTTLDTDSIGTDATYTLTDADAGKTLKVVVSFTDDGGNSEGPLTSAATRAITAAASCAAPTLTGGAVFLGPARKVGVGEFDLGGHAYHGFNKAEDAGSIDNASFTTAASNNYEILGAATKDSRDWMVALDGAFPANVQRTLAVHFCDEDIAFNAATPRPRDGIYYYTSATPPQHWAPHAERTIYVSQDTAAPTFASATVSGTTLVITLSEDLGAAGSLANSAFTVKKGPSGSQTTLTLSSTAPEISGSTVTLTLATASTVSATDTNVLVTYTKPTTGTANKLLDAFGNETGTFEDQVVLSHCNPLDPLELWCANLTVGSNIVGGQNYWGYSVTPSVYGSIAPNTFPYRTATIGVTYLEYGAFNVDFGIALNSGTVPADGLLGTGGFTLEIGTGTSKNSFAINNLGTRKFVSFTDPGLSWSVDDTVPVKLLRRVNAPAAGTPAVTAPNVFRVPAVLGVDLSGITDTDGTTGIATIATYKWQRFAADGTTLDTDSIGTSSTYTLTDADAGKTLKVVVSFTDDAGTSEGPLTSAATSAITAAASCAAPTYVGGATQIGPARKLTVQKFIDGGVLFHGFLPRLSAGSLDNGMFTTAASNSHQILNMFTGIDGLSLTNDTVLSASDHRTLVLHVCDHAYPFSASSNTDNLFAFIIPTVQNWSQHAERTIYLSQDTAAPAFASATVNGTSLVITFNEPLGAAASLANSAFTVKKGPSGSQTTLTLSSTAPVISGSTVTLTLATASTVTASDTNVLVTYTKPTTGTANKLVDAFGNETGTFEDQVVTNLLSGTNTPPTVANIIPDQSATVSTSFSYTFPDTTFADADLDTLTYSATKADGTALPMWLTFTAGTRTFSGTPTAAETVSVKVTASDGNGGSVSDTFDITVRTAANTAPTAANATVDTDQDTSYTFTAADFNYSDPDNNPLASVKITTIPAAGKGTLALDGTNIVSAVLPQTVTAAELNTSKLKYNPPANENGTAYTSFEFKVNDGTVDSAGEYTITINVNPIHTAPLVHPANTLVSSINHASSGTYTVRPHGDLAIQLPPPAPQESRYEDGWNLNTIKIRVSGVDAGEQIYGRLHPGKSVQNNPGSSGPATGVGSSSGNPFRSVSVSPDGIATFSNPDPSGFNPKSQYFYFIVSVNSGEIEVGKTATADLDAGTPNDLNLGPTWHRADNSWSADSTATDRIQILITGSVKPVDVISPEPPPVPSRPSAPNDGVSTYRLGSWRSVNLTGAEEFGDAIYKVRLQKDTNYRVEFRTANSYASATAIDAGILVTNNLVDLEAVNSGAGSPFIVEVGEDGNPSTTLAKATSWFRYNTSSLEQGIWSNMLYQDFRTPDILEAGGNADCDAESEAKLVQETDCVYQFDYPTYYYLNIGTGIDVPKGEYGTMQFRISRTTDQTLGGMSRMSEDSEASFSIPAHIEDPVSENGSAVDNKLSADGEIHFAGDVDWYIPEHSATACSFSVTGRDLDGDSGTNDSASGLRMRAYDRNFGERAAPSNRGSFRSSLSGVLPSDGEKLLEVTGTRAGGYRIIVTCEDLPAEGPTTDRLGNLIPHIQIGNSKRYFDDHLPYNENLSEEVEQVDKYGHEVIDLTARTSGSVTATISYPGDGDYFRLTGTPGRRYSITLSSVAATLSTPGHPDGNTVRLQRLDLGAASSAQPHAVSCKRESRIEGTESNPILVFLGHVPTSNQKHVTEFDDDANVQNIKADLDEGENCLFIRVGLLYQDALIGGYRITVRDEGVPPHPARADAHSPLMYDAEDLHLLRGDSPGMHVFITRETYTDGDGNSYPPSSSFGSIAGNGRIDSNDDIDLFRRRVSPGLYEVFIQSEAVRSRSYDEDKSNDAARLNSTRDRAHNNTLRAAFSVLEGSQGADAGSAVDLTPGDDSSFDSLANPGTAICTTVRQESYVDENTSERKTRPTYECKATTIATFEAEYSDYYYVTVFRQYDQPNLGTYRVNMRAVQAPSLSGLANASNAISRNATVKATVRNPRETPVYAQYHKQGDTAWIDLDSKKTSEDKGDRLQQSLDVEFALVRPDPDTDYIFRASLTEDFSSGVRTLNIRTAADPAVSRVRESNLTHNSAAITVSLTNGRVDDYVKIWLKKTSDPDSVTWAKYTIRLSASNLNTAVFYITILQASTSYDVRVVTSRSTIDDALPDLYSSHTFSTQADPN